MPAATTPCAPTRQAVPDGTASGGDAGAAAGAADAVNTKMEGNDDEDCGYLRKRTGLSALWPYAAIQALRGGERRACLQPGGGYQRQRTRGLGGLLAGVRRGGADQLYPGVSGDADAQVAALLAGSLQYDPNTVCAHHHNHGEGHNCGAHGHDCGGHRC